MKRLSDLGCLPLRETLTAGALAAALVLGAEGARGQAGPDMTAVYGRGIHAYFANRTSQADAYFSQVINAGSQDPRVFYFRALARLRAGRQYEAQQDMQLGAMFEARDPGASGSIGQALTRVQGRHRQVLEQYRRQARTVHSQDQAALAQTRYQEQRRQETEVLRQETPVDLGALAGGEASPGAASAPVVPPVVDATPQPALEDEPAPPAADDSLDPFGGSESAAETTPMVVEPAPPADVPAADDPFGSGFGDEPAADAEEDLPFGADPTSPGVDEPATPDADDPFGGLGGEEPAAEAPADETPPATDDLFSAPAAAGASDDPFSPGFAPNDPSAETPTTAPTDQADGQGGEGGGLLGRVLGRTFSDLMPSLPTTLPGLGESDEPAGAPPAEAFDFGPDDAPMASDEAGDIGAAASPDDPFNPGGDDPFATAPSDDEFEAPAESPADDATPPPAGDPFSGGGEADPFGGAEYGAAEDAATADDETEAPAEEPAAEEDGAEGTLEDDPFGDF